jgi:hypothetical protein
MPSLSLQIVCLDRSLHSATDRSPLVGPVKPAKKVAPQQTPRKGSASRASLARNKQNARSIAGCRRES